MKEQKLETEKDAGEIIPKYDVSLVMPKNTSDKKIEEIKKKVVDFLCELTSNKCAVFLKPEKKVFEYMERACK